MDKHYSNTSQAHQAWGDESQFATLEAAWARRAAQLAHKPEAEELGEQIQLVLVRLEQEIYGLDASYIFDVRPLDQITPVPRTPDWSEGVVNLRGRIISVLDLRRFLGLQGNGNPTADETYQLVVTETADMELALKVNEVSSVISFPLNRIRAVDALNLNIPVQYVRGIAEPEENGEHGLVVVLDLPVLLSDPQIVVYEEFA